VEPLHVYAALGAVAALFAVAALVLKGKLSAARAALAEAEKKLAAPPPPRVVEGREERFGLLWFPALTLDDSAKTVIAVAAGKPWCPRCLKTLALSAGADGEWTCAACGEKRAGTAADMTVVDQVVANALREFLGRNAGWKASPSLPAHRKPVSS
jgi:ribosomal protein L37AE/L43A